MAAAPQGRISVDQLSKARRPAYSAIEHPSDASSFASTFNTFRDQRRGALFNSRLFILFK